MGDIVLKLCPFCGGEASVHTVDIDDRNWVVECKHCRIQTSWHGDKLTAIEKWNRRMQECGEWVYGEYDIPHCSKCGSEVEEVSPFCPHCGARMDEDDD